MTHLLGFLTSNVFSALAGGFLGYHFCIFVSHRRESKVTGDPSNHQARNGVVVVLIGLLFVALGVYIAVNQTQRSADAQETADRFKAQQDATEQRFADFRECINDYSTLLAEAQRTRSKASAELDAARQREFDANADLWALISRSFTSGTQVSRDEGQAALGRYLAAASHEKDVLHDLQAERKKHPYPEPPEVACR